MRTKNWTQENALAAGIPCSPLYAAGSYATDAINASIYDRLVATVNIGLIGGAATLTVKGQYASASGGAWSDISSASCVTSTFTSLANGSYAHLELRNDQNPSASMFVRFLASTVTSTATFGVTVFGQPNYAPAKDVDLAAVVQITVF